MVDAGGKLIPKCTCVIQKLTILLNNNIINISFNSSCMGGAGGKLLYLNVHA